MATDIKAPQFPESVADGTVATWHKKEGEAVKRDELLVDIETDKVVLEVVAPSEIQPGDLVFFRIGGKEQHAGIYMGGNHFMHASTSIGVTLSELDGYYWKDRFTQARRFD